MSLSVVTNPIDENGKVFAGFNPIEFLFKREDLAVTSTQSGTGGTRINIGADLTTYLNVGNSVYLYSEGTNYTYNVVASVLEVTSGYVTIDTPFYEVSTGGYINYFRNYYVEVQVVNTVNTDINLLDFSLESDGAPNGDILVDVSILNDLNRQREDMLSGHVPESSKQFKVKYRQVYDTSSETFTVFTNIAVVVYATEEPETEEVLNSFELPKIFLGYEAAFAIAHKTGSASDTLELIYKELDINNNELASDTLGSLNSEKGGFMLWNWPANTSVEDSARFITFEFSSSGAFDFVAGDFAHPDFVVQ